KQYFNSDIVAAVAVIGGVFLLTLLIVSVFTIRVSDMVLDSRVGALDRTLGFLFGLARGLIIVVIAFQFSIWLVPDRSQPQWVKGAKSKVVLAGTGQWLMSMLPDDPESTILNKLKRARPEDTEPPAAAPARRRSAVKSPEMQRSCPDPPPSTSTRTGSARNAAYSAYSDIPTQQRSPPWACTLCSTAAKRPPGSSHSTASGFTPSGGLVWSATRSPGVR